MNITKELLERHSKGECSDLEKKAVEKWMSMQEDAATGLEMVDETAIDDTKIWAKVQQLSPELEVSSGDLPTANPLYKRVLRYAAAAIILFTVGFFGYRAYFSDAQAEVEQVLALKTIETQRGEKRTVILSDGSTIRMNYETQIKAPEKFEGDERVVYLTGHAHFNVARDTERPFIIYTEDSKTQVLGTSFDINTKEEGETEIIVMSGKVAFSEKEQGDNLVTLTVNDRAVLNEGKNIATEKVNAMKLTAWRENKLIFEGETLAEIIKVLEPWYDITVEVEDPDLLKKDFLLSRENPPLTDVLDRLGFIGGFEYAIEGNNVSLFKTE